MRMVARRSKMRRMRRAKVERRAGGELAAARDSMSVSMRLVLRLRLPVVRMSADDFSMVSWSLERTKSCAELNAVMMKASSEGRR